MPKLWVRCVRDSELLTVLPWVWSSSRMAATPKVSDTADKVRKCRPLLLAGDALLVLPLQDGGPKRPRSGQTWIKCPPTPPPPPPPPLLFPDSALKTSSSAHVRLGSLVEGSKSQRVTSRGSGQTDPVHVCRTDYWWYGTWFILRGCLNVKTPSLLWVSVLPELVISDRNS